MSGDVWDGNIYWRVGFIGFRKDNCFLDGIAVILAVCLFDLVILYYFGI